MPSACYSWQLSTAGGRLWSGPDDALELRVFIDGSAVEVFTGTGQALTTRVYRGSPSSGGGGADESRLRLCSAGGAALVERLEVSRLRSAWARGDVDTPLPPPATTAALQAWLDAFAAKRPAPGSSS